MFDFVRQHTRIMQFLLFLLIFPSFVLFGIEGYSRFNEKGNAVATVDGQDISQAEWDNAHRQQVERMRAAMPTADIKLFDSPEARQSTLDRLIRERVMLAAARRLNLQVSDQRLASELQQDPNIASLRKADGSLDIERYRQLLSSQGMTPESFEARVRADLGVRQVMNGVLWGSVAPVSLADVALNAFYEQRQVRVARFEPAEFQAQAQPTDAQLQDYYRENAERFQSPERADIEYLVLDLAAVQKNLTVSEADLRSFYEQNQSRLAALEERRVSHILIAADRQAPAAEREKARAKAQGLLDELQKNPARFAELARQNSQDPGSSNKGGDLDFINRGSMVKPFEEAAFGLKKGETSGLVETEFGYHILRVTDIRSPKGKSFEESRASLEADARRQLAQRKFAEAAEQFTNLVYEQSDSLKPAAEKLQLDIRRANDVGRDESAPVLPAPLNNARLLTAIFAPDATEKQRNTEAVEVGPSQLAAARVVRYSPTRTLPFETVKARVRELLVQRMAADKAREQGQARLAEWRQNPANAKLTGPLTLSREQKQQLPSTVVEAALRAPTASLPAWVGVDLGTSGYAVVKVEAIVPRDAQASRNREREREQFSQWWSTAEGLAYYRHLKSEFKVTTKATGL
jgi:peptidyl-prolyl cis-trans isomerase D